METRDNLNAPTSALSAEGVNEAPLATAAALDSSTFAALNPDEAIPASWEERARKAWEYYLEEPLVKNCVNSWRTFAVGDEIKLSSDDETLKDDAIEAAARLKVSRFVKDMVLQLLVKDDAGRPFAPSLPSRPALFIFGRRHRSHRNRSVPVLRTLSKIHSFALRPQEKGQSLLANSRGQSLFWVHPDFAYIYRKMCAVL